MDPPLDYPALGNFNPVPPPTHLFPIPVSSGFTTSSATMPNVEHVAFDDKTLGVHARWARSVRVLAEPARGRHAWETLYRNGSVNPGGDIAGVLT